ncbi:hypothetical protein EBZ39_07275 [bacterium]|nr:hypothetical protein [bacterium]
MGCCNNNNKNCQQTPKEEFGDMASWIIKGLMDVARTGRIVTLFKNQAADQLAVMIATVVEENKYLRAILGVMKPDIAVNGETFQIAFGPSKQYSLTIPITTDAARKEIINDLRLAIAQLESANPPAIDKQLELFEALK